MLNKLRLNPLKYKELRNASTKRAAFNFEDPLNYKSLLSQEELEIQDSVRKYCQEKLMPRVTNGYRNETFDKEIMREMGSLGLLGIVCTFLVLVTLLLTSVRIDSQWLWM